jgi:hypothetical protein
MSAAVVRAIQALSDEALEQLIRIERKRRHQARQLCRQETHRWVFPRRLTRGDQLQVMRRKGAV